MSPTIRILGREKPISVAAGATLLDAITAAGYAVAADCGARGKCGRCKIKVLEGVAALPLTPIEAKRLGELEATQALRLACQHEAVDGWKGSARRPSSPIWPARSWASSGCER